MTKGLSEAITAVQKNLDKPTEELAQLIKPYTAEICEMYDAMNHCCAYDRMEHIAQTGYRDEAPAWEGQQWD